MLARLLPQGSGRVSEERGRGMKRGGIIILAGVLGLVALLAGGVGAFPPERPMAQGGAPTLISYQGRLTDPSTGDPKPDGNYSMTFRLFSTQSGGSSIWSETQMVSVSGGLFNVLLGSVNPLSASDFSGPDRWLEVQVEADPAMIPRASGWPACPMLYRHRRRSTRVPLIASTLRASPWPAITTLGQTSPLA